MSHGEITDGGDIRADNSSGESSFESGEFRATHTSVLVGKEQAAPTPGCAVSSLTVPGPDGSLEPRDGRRRCILTRVASYLRKYWFPLLRFLC